MGSRQNEACSHLHHAVGVHERAFGAVRGADRCPFRLLTVQPARMPATRLARRQRHTRTHRWSARTRRARAAMPHRSRARELEPHEARAQIRQVDIAAPAAGARRPCTVVQRLPPSEARTRNPPAGASPSQSMTRPPTVRGAVASITIQGFWSAACGFHPRPVKASVASYPGSALEACARGGSAGVRSRISRSAMNSVPSPPSPATMASSMKPSCVMPEPLEGPHAKSISRLSTSRRFQRPGGTRFLKTCRHTFEPARIDELELEVVRRAPPAQPQAHGILLRAWCDRWRGARPRSPCRP